MRAMLRAGALQFSKNERMALAKIMSHMVDRYTLGADAKLISVSLKKVNRIRMLQALLQQLFKAFHISQFVWCAFLTLRLPQ